MDEQNEIQVQTSTLPTMDFGPTQMAAHLKQLQQFIGGQLRERHDYGTIPGCGSKPSLFKPGAEKLGALFNLKPSFTCTIREIDHENRRVTYEYRCQVGKIIDGKFIVFGECEAGCNSSESKYRNRAYTDVMNTIMKMAQKRAYVGAMILATGASEYFTQDLEDMDTGGNDREDTGESRNSRQQAKPAAAAHAQPAAPKQPDAATVAATGAIKVICDVAWPELGERMTELEFAQAVTGGKFDTIEQIKSCARADLKGGHGAVQVCEWAKKADELIKKQPA